eukprot:9468416-Pyramimonas_sp.AAC.1
MAELVTSCDPSITLAPGSHVVLSGWKRQPPFLQDGAALLQICRPASPALLPSCRLVLLSPSKVENACRHFCKTALRSCKSVGLPRWRCRRLPSPSPPSSSSSSSSFGL